MIFSTFNFRFASDCTTKHTSHRIKSEPLDKGWSFHRLKNTRIESISSSLYKTKYIFAFTRMCTYTTNARMQTNVPRFCKHTKTHANAYAHEPPSRNNFENKESERLQDDEQTAAPSSPLSIGKWQTTANKRTNEHYAYTEYVTSGRHTLRRRSRWMGKCANKGFSMREIRWHHFRWSILRHVIAQTKPQRSRCYNYHVSSPSFLISNLNSNREVTQNGTQSRRRTWDRIL